MKRIAASIPLAALVLGTLALLGCDKKAPGGEPPPGGSAPPHEIPAEAYTVCDGKKADDACTVKMGEREQAGKCAAAPEGASDTRLSCRPERPAKKAE
jgi:hypothetical protein